MTVAIAGPDRNPVVVNPALPSGACDCHAHIFGPPDRFPYAEGRGYTPPDATLEMYLALHDRLGFTRGVVVQGNAHGYDNSAILDALARTPGRLRGVAITDARVGEKDLRAWHDLGVRGLRFHVFHPDHRPGYVRGVGLDVFALFRKTMCQRRSKTRPVGRSKTRPLSVMRYAVLRVVPVVHRRDPRCFA